MNVNQKDYVELELLNQRLSELSQTMEFANQQLEHSAIALEMLNALTNITEGQELLVPLGGGTFATVDAKDIKNVKVVVGAGVVVEKPVLEAINYINKQAEQINIFSLETNNLYEQTVSRALKLQEKIEKEMRSK
ncbi:prefoldin subunit alpha [Candidatus Woesearchaeota archaeon]|nr:prefoldin subunit alpha [Candidatus Woesearchaeota archaeon]